MTDPTTRTAREWCSGHDHLGKLQELEELPIPVLKQLSLDLDTEHKFLQERANEALYVRVMVVTLLRQNGEYS